MGIELTVIALVAKMQSTLELKMGLWTAIELFFAGFLFSGELVLYANADYAYPEIAESVVEVQAHREWWRDDGEHKCYFNGVMVAVPKREYTDSGVFPVTNNASNKSSATEHAVIFHQKTCNKLVEHVLYVGTVPSYTLFNRWTKASAAFTVDTLTAPVHEIPSWLGPVLNRLERSAHTQFTAANFWLDAAEDIAKVRHKLVQPKKKSTEESKNSFNFEQVGP